jgi:hypothetical protein
MIQAVGSFDQKWIAVKFKKCWPQSDYQLAICQNLLSSVSLKITASERIFLSFPYILGKCNILKNNQL